MRRVAIGLGVLALLAGGLFAVRGRVLGGSEPPQPAPVADPASQRTPPAGPVVGFVGRYGSHVWRGIPYARPPVGDLRWRAPEPLPAWTEPRPALAFGGHCPQLASPFGGVEGEPGTLSGTEDCLYLNVFAPRMDAGAVPTGAQRLPVMVWIHGGGNTIGLSDFYDGGALAEREGVVVVTLNYRLGPFGWFRHAALREADGSPEDRSGNYGTLDLVRGLEWVRENIAAFGGDPERVTIFGESAGGTNVYTLLLSPNAAGLFQRAIVQSGGVGFDSVAEAEHWRDDSEPGHPRSSNEVIARLLAAEAVPPGSGDAPPDPAAVRGRVTSMAPDELAAWLRTKTPAEIFAAYAPGEGELLLDLPRVFADGSVIPAGDPLERLASPDGWNRVPVMVGTTRDENKLFLFANPLYVQRWLGVVPRVRDEALYLATADAMSAMWKATGADGPASAMRRSQPHVFVYRFDFDEWPSLLGFDAGRFLGAAHGLEIPFVFSHWDLGAQGRFLLNEENRAAREALAAQVGSYWAAFAADGDPAQGRRGELPAWTAWDGRSGGHKYVILDTAAGGGLRMGSEAVTVESVIAAVDEDPRLASQRERCWVYHELAQWSRGFGPDDYASAGREGCAAYPFDAFPWES